MDAVSRAMATVRRDGFLREADRRRAGHDGPLGIGHDQTNSQPRTVEAMLRLLDVRPGQQVLDVGAGSGWTTALLARLVGPDGRVRGVELVPELAAWGAANLPRPTSRGRAWWRRRRATLGLPDHAPYDRILVSAEPSRLPDGPGGAAGRGRRPDGHSGRERDAAGRAAAATSAR